MSSRLLPASLLLLALLAGSVTASRLKAPWERSSNSKALRWMQMALLGEGGAEAGETAITAVKYDVPTSVHKEFLDAWYKVQGNTTQEKGLITYDLSKTTADNVYFWGYGEWESMDKYFDHFKSNYTQEFMNFLDDNDIIFEIFPLKNIADNTKRGKTTRVAVSQGKGGGDDPREGPAHVFIQYFVPPSVSLEFMDVWKELAERTWDEKENILYALHKIGSMNQQFVTYGSWESFDAYLDHHTSRHMDKLHGFMADNDIMFFVEPVKKLGEQPEKKTIY